MTNFADIGPRPLDHVVLPTARLEVARARLASLGFTVAPEGVHPFGTVNCCVYLADGTFLEPLAVGDVVAADRAVADDNVFVARDRMFRKSRGEEGFSAVVFGTSDADVDHAEFVTAKVSAGPRLDFSRPFVDASGRADQASFRLAFAALSDTSDGAFVFTCERANAPKVDRSALQAHANGAMRIAGVEASAADIADAGRFLAAVGRSDALAVGQDEASVALANTNLTVRAPASAEGLGLDALVFGVGNLAAARSLLVQNGIEHDLTGQRLVIPPAPGQGATFIFEELK